MPESKEIQEQIGNKEIDMYCVSVERVTKPFLSICNSSKTQEEPLSINGINLEQF